MTDTLQLICRDKHAHIAARKRVASLAEVEEMARAQTPVRGFHVALQQSIAGGDIGLIAEIKKASPSRGVIRADFDPPVLARAYAEGGATCVSVLTDTPYFQGQDAYLQAVRAAVDLPLLRKDFMLDPYQIVESRALGADCVLLIMAALSDAQAAELEAAAQGLDMDVLVEVHDADEVERALTHLATRLLGINNRSLKTLSVDLATCEALAPHVPEDYTLVAESGIATSADIQRMQRAGIHCFLVGESLMAKPDVAAATQILLGGA